MMRESRNPRKSISMFLNQYLIYYVLLSAGRFTRAEEFGKIVFQSLARSRCQTCIEQYDGSLPSVFWRISFCWWFRRYWTASAELFLKPLPRADIMASIGVRYQNHCVSGFDQPTISFSGLPGLYSFHLLADHLLHRRLQVVIKLIFSREVFHLTFHID